MANYTINNLPNTVAELNSADTLAVWDSANSKTAKINGSNLSNSILSKLVVVDTVAEGNKNSVTSNAVNDALTDGTKELTVKCIKTTGHPQGSGSGLFISREDSNDEGGQLELERPVNSNFNGNIIIDVWLNRVRFFAGYKGEIRTFYIDFETKTFGFD